MTVIAPGPEGWVPGRGDYGAEYASDLVMVIEARNCVKGCTLAGSRAVRDEFGPGGQCEILARTYLGEPIPELDPRPDGPHCTARIDPATDGMDPLFEGGGS